MRSQANTIAQVAHTNRDAGLPGSLGGQIRIPYLLTNSGRTDRVTVGLFKP